MPRKVLRYIALIFCFGFHFAGGGAFAENLATSPATPVEVAPGAEAVAAAAAKPAKPKVSTQLKKTQSKGGKRTREKDADGTEAPNRFQADTVIKSQYKLNGQSLEVDTD